ALGLEENPAATDRDPLVRIARIAARHVIDLHVRRAVYDVGRGAAADDDLNRVPLALRPFHHGASDDAVVAAVGRCPRDAALLPGGLLLIFCSGIDGGGAAASDRIRVAEVVLLDLALDAFRPDALGVRRRVFAPDEIEAARIAPLI